MLVLLGLIAAGCSGGSDLLPLSTARSWTYSVRTPFTEAIEAVTVSGRVPVDGVQGWVLSGPMGTNHIAWSQGRLVAARLANASFSPALPFGLAKTPPPPKRTSKGAPPRVPVATTWKGQMEAFGVRTAATATLKQREEKVLIGGAAVPCAASILTIRAPGRQIEIRTWFRPGVGIVRQEQRTNRQLVVKLATLDVD